MKKNEKTIYLISIGILLIILLIQSVKYENMQKIAYEECEIINLATKALNICSDILKENNYSNFPEIKKIESCSNIK